MAKFFFLLFFCLMFSLVGKRWSCGPTTSGSPPPRRHGVAACHVMSPESRRHACCLAPLWKHVAPMAVLCKSSPRYLAPARHPLTTQRRTLGTTALPSPLLTPPLHFGTPHHHGAQDLPPRHTTPPWRHIATSHHPTTVHKPGMLSPAHRLS